MKCKNTAQVVIRKTVTAVMRSNWSMSSILGFVTRRLHFTLTAGWVNYANELSQLSQAALERASQHVHDNVTASQQRGCVDSKRCGTFDRMNIQNVSTSRLYNRLCNRMQSVHGPWDMNVPLNELQRAAASVCTCCTHYSVSQSTSLGLTAYIQPAADVHIIRSHRQHAVLDVASSVVCVFGTRCIVQKWINWSWAGLSADSSGLE